jgi:putative OPT family oligopeptide transporter
MSQNSKYPAYRELTISAMVLGIILGSIMTSAFVYIGLKLGFTLGGSTVAAIMGFAILRGVLKKGTIVENNINQTIASGINTASAGVAFTLPALFLMSVKNPEYANFDILPFLFAGTAGSFLGIVLIIPLRKQMLEFERLRFPTGIAVSKLLKSPGAGIHQAKMLGIGFGVAALFHTLEQLGHAPSEVDLGSPLGIASHIPFIVALSFANFGAGLLSGKGGLPFALGGVLAWWVISPIAVGQGWVSGDPAHSGLVMDQVYGSMLRPLGIGMLIGGAIAGVVLSFPALKSAIQSLSAASKMKGGSGGSDELGSRALYTGLVAAVIVLFIAAMSVEGVSTLQAVGISVVGTLWLGLAGLIVAQATGMTDISPLSGLALIAVTLMFFLTSGNVIAAVMLGVAVCIGIGQCADMMQDLKTGHLVGSTPKRQQIAQFLVAWMGVPIAIFTVYLLWGSAENPGFGPGTDLPAPQAGALSGIIESLVGGDVALDKYAAGAGLGGALAFYPIGGLGVLVGLAMYLPFSITLGYGIGCVVSIYLGKKMGNRWMGETLIPLAAGFIVGEALTNLTAVLIRLAS